MNVWGKQAVNDFVVDGKGDWVRKALSDIVVVKMNVSGMQGVILW